MERRRFIQILGVTVVSGVALGAVGGSVLLVGPLAREDPTADFGGARYRGTRDGKILVSRDAGGSWDLHTNLGPELIVERLHVDRRGHLVATMGFEGYTFGLMLRPDERSWVTT